jgi:23S rRNA (uracil1939-C5)-methyltransferase
VSCDPATLARDLRVLSAAGYAIEQAHLVDLFPQTFHLESVLQLVKQ